MQHRGPHPAEYDQWVLDKMRLAEKLAGDDKEKFVRLFKEYESPSTKPGATKLLWTHSESDVSRVPDWLCLLPDIVAVSDRFKDVLEKHRSGLDEFGWIAARIELSSGSQVQRWIPLFGGDADVLDQDATDWGPSGLPIRWYLAASKTAGRRAFALPGRTSHMIVSSDILSALREQRMGLLHG